MFAAWKYLARYRSRSPVPKRGVPYQPDEKKYMQNSFSALNSTVCQSSKNNCTYAGTNVDIFVLTYQATSHATVIWIASARIHDRTSVIERKNAYLRTTYDNFRMDLPSTAEPNRLYLAFGALKDMLSISIRISRTTLGKFISSKNVW